MNNYHEGVYNILCMTVYNTKEHDILKQKHT